MKKCRAGDGTSIPNDNATFGEERGAATAALHRDIEATLRRYARSLTRDAVAADDLVQECVARALAKLHLWRAGTDMRAWLFTIVHNQYATQLRRGTCERMMIEWSDCAQALTWAPQQIERLELRDLERAIMSLSEEHRTAVLPLGLTPANYKEVASACGVPVNTIRSRASRGRTTLRKLMGIAPSQHSLASRPLRFTAAATTVRQERRPPDCRFDISQEVGHLPPERSAHPRQHGDLRRQADLIEGRIDIRSKAWGWRGSEGSWSSDPQRTEPLLDELA
jgi:RNA polymerase sigma-70 factor (ECF subfamily)